MENALPLTISDRDNVGWCSAERVTSCDIVGCRPNEEYCSVDPGAVGNVPCVDCRAREDCKSDVLDAGTSVNNEDCCMADRGG